jgi:hypothetical protein
MNSQQAAAGARNRSGLGSMHARIGLAGICAGVHGNGHPYRDPRDGIKPPLP